MPIDRRELEAGGRAYSPVLEFLKNAKDQGFTLSELTEALGESGLTLDDLDAALHVLDARELIDVQLVENRVYYGYRIPLGFQLE